MSSSTSNPQPSVKTEPSDNTAPGAMPLPTQDWDENTIIASLARLEMIQEQIDSLRQTMPLLVRSLTRSHDTPQDLYNDFRNITVRTQKKLISVKQSWESKETREIFERAKVRAGEKVVVDVEDIKAVPAYGWIEEVERKKNNNNNNKRKFEQTGGEEDDVLDEEGIKKVVEEYGQKHEGLTAVYKDNTIKVEFNAAANIPLSFLVTRKLMRNHPIYKVESPTRPDTTSSTHELFNAIDRCMDKRPKPNDLQNTLEMIAAYKDLRASKCDTCKELIGPNGLAPAARKSKTVTGPDGLETQEWVSIHESCLPP